MASLPREPGFDSTLALLREGYRFIGSRCSRLGSDVFETRLMLRRAVCMRGADAAEFFYAGDRFTRVGAMPVTVLKLLQDFGSVQLKDGAAHRHRKALFLSLTDPQEIERICELMAAEWTARLPYWQRAESIVLFDEIRAVLTRAALRWAGIDFDEAEADRRTRELSEMIESTGSVGPRNWRALFLRSRSERWARGIIEGVRSGRLQVAPGSPVQSVASFRDPDGEPLKVREAAVELLNLLRPTVAVGRFVTFVAQALHAHPEAAERIRSGDEEYLDAFAEEVRRISPFFPFIGGRARQDLEWKGHRFASGTWVLLDLYGTNRHPALWDDPEAFRPERFIARRPGLFEFMPQGAGEPALTHRCPGEGITTGLMKTAGRLLTRSMRYEVPDQDLSVDLARIPALPKSGFVMTKLDAAR